MKKITVVLLLITSFVMPVKSGRYTTDNEQGYKRQLNYVFGLIYDHICSDNEINFVVTKNVKKELSRLSVSYRFQLDRDLEKFQRGSSKFYDCDNYNKIDYLQGVLQNKKIRGFSNDYELEQILENFYQMDIEKVKERREEITQKLLEVLKKKTQKKTQNSQ